MAGPLAEWLQSSIIFSEINTKIEPLRLSLKEYQQECELLNKDMELKEALIKSLEEALEQYQ